VTSIVVKYSDIGTFLQLMLDVYLLLSACSHIV